MYLKFAFLNQLLNSPYAKRSLLLLISGIDTLIGKDDDVGFVLLEFGLYIFSSSVESDLMNVSSLFVSSLVNE
jgi:hypothetical protein